MYAKLCSMSSKSAYCSHGIWVSYPISQMGGSEQQEHVRTKPIAP